MFQALIAAGIRPCKTELSFNVQCCKHGIVAWPIGTKTCIHVVRIRCPLSVPHLAITPIVVASLTSKAGCRQKCKEVGISEHPREEDDRLPTYITGSQPARHCSAGILQSSIATFPRSISSSSARSFARLSFLIRSSLASMIAPRCGHTVRLLQTVIQSVRHT